MTGFWVWPVKVERGVSERFRGLWRIDFFGILRCAQDDSNNRPCKIHEFCLKLQLAKAKEKAFVDNG
jgi:hypothetical protein